MPSFTIEQWAIVGLVFVAGWLLGLASHSGGRKWRERYAVEREAHAAARRDADTRVAAAEARHAELERDYVRERAATPVVAQPVVTQPLASQPVAAPAMSRPVATRAARPAFAAGERRGWFDWGARR